MVRTKGQYPYIHNMQNISMLILFQLANQIPEIINKVIYNHPLTNNDIPIHLTKNLLLPKQKRDSRISILAVQMHMLAYERLRIVLIGLVDKRMTNRVGIKLNTSENNRGGERKKTKRENSQNPSS